MWARSRWRGEGWEQRSVCLEQKEAARNVTVRETHPVTVPAAEVASLAAGDFAEVIVDAQSRRGHLLRASRRPAHGGQHQIRQWRFTLLE